MPVLSLTKIQKETMDNLKSKEYKAVSQANVTKILKKSLDEKDTAEEILPWILAFEKFKFPDKSEKQIDTYITKKLDKSDREVYREVAPQVWGSDIIVDSSGKTRDEFVDEDEKHNSSSVTSKPTTSRTLDTGPKTQNSKVDNLLDKLLKDHSIDEQNDSPYKGKAYTVDVGSEVGKAKPKMGGYNNNKVVGPKKTGKSLDLSESAVDVFGKGNAYYQANKEQVNKIFAKLNEENLKDGSLISAIAGLAVPELEIIQKVSQAIPGIALTDSQDDALTKMLSRDSSVRRSVSTKEAWESAGKMLVNPERLGKFLIEGVESVGGEIGDSFENLYRTLAGKKQLPSVQERNKAKRDASLKAQWDEYTKNFTDAELKDISAKMDDSIKAGKPPPRSMTFQERQQDSRINFMESTIDAIGGFYDLEGISDRDKGIALQRLKQQPGVASELARTVLRYTKGKEFPTFDSAYASLPGTIQRELLENVKGKVQNYFKQINIPAKLKSRTPTETRGEAGAGQLIDDSSKLLLDGAIKGNDALLNQVTEFVKRGQGTKEDLDSASALRKQLMNARQPLLDAFQSVSQGYNVDAGAILDDAQTIMDLAVKSAPKFGEAAENTSRAVQKIMQYYTAKPAVQTDVGSDSTPDTGRKVKIEDQPDNSEPVDDGEGGDEGPVEPAGSSRFTTKKIDESDGVPELRPQFPAGGSMEMMGRDPMEVQMATKILDQSHMEYEPSDNSLFARQKILEQRALTGGYTIKPPEIPSYPPITGRLAQEMSPLWISPAPASAEKSWEQRFVNKNTNGVFTEFEERDPETVFPRWERYAHPNEHPDYTLRIENSDKDVAQQVAGFKSGFDTAINMMRRNGMYV